MFVWHCVEMKSCISSVGSSQHASAISSLIVADRLLHYIIQNFKQFFLPSKNLNDAMHIKTSIIRSRSEARNTSTTTNYIIDTYMTSVTTWRWQLTTGSNILILSSYIEHCNNHSDRSTFVKIILSFWNRIFKNFTQKLYEWSKCTVMHSGIARNYV